MLRNKFAGYLAVVALMLLASMLSPKVFSGEGDKDDAPMICEACTFECTLTVKADTVYPGHMARVPFGIYLEEGNEIDGIQMRMTLETGLTYVSIDTTGTAWDSTINASSGTSIDIDFVEGTLGSDGGPYFHLFDLIVQVAGTVGFSDTKDLTFETNGYQVKSLGGGWCDTEIDTGWVTIPEGEVWFWADTTIGYSYQARDPGDTCKATLIWVPILFKATFPVDSLWIGLHLDDSLDQYYQSFESGPGTNTILEWAPTRPNGRIKDYVTLYPPTNEKILGWLKFKGANHRDSLNARCGFTDVDTLNFQPSASVHCDSSEQKITWGDMNVTTGGIEYPVYSCSTSIGSDTVGVDLSVSLPVRANHTFWSQYYKYFVKVDTSCLTLSGVTLPSGDYVQSVEGSPSGQSADGVYKTYKVEVNPNPQSCKYVLPNSNEVIFNLDFVATDSFADNSSNSTIVSFNTTNYDNEVHDYFHVSGSKVERESDSTAYFYVSSGTVDVPRFFAVAIDTVSGCDTSEVTGDYTVPVRVTRVTQNDVDSIWFKILCPDTQFIEITDFSTGDFSFTGTSYKISKTGDAITVNLGMNHGAIDTEGVVCYLTCDINSPVLDFAELNFDYWHMNWPLGPGMNPTHMFDGGIDECSGGGKREPPTLPLAYRLNQNYPNPFNAQTKISFVLPEPCDVEINIFDILGRQVRKLIDGSYPSGTYEVIWDGKNNTGQVLSSGIYIYSMRATDFVESKKMLMLK